MRRAGAHIATIALIVSFGALSTLTFLPNTSLSLLISVAAVAGTFGLAVLVGRLHQRSRTSTSNDRTGATAQTRREQSIGGRGESKIVRHVRRSRGVIYFHPIYSVPLLGVQAAFAATMHWWSLLVIVPFNIAVFWFFDLGW